MITIKDVEKKMPIGTDIVDVTFVAFGTFKEGSLVHILETKDGETRYVSCINAIQLLKYDFPRTFGKGLKFYKLGNRNFMYFDVNQHQGVVHPKEYVFGFTVETISHQYSLGSSTLLYKNCPVMEKHRNERDCWGFTYALKYAIDNFKQVVWDIDVHESLTLAYYGSPVDLNEIVNFHNLNHYIVKYNKEVK